MTKILTIILIASAILVFDQCSSPTDQRITEARDAIGRDVSNEKQGVVNDLRWLKDDINDRLDEISIKLETASDKSKDGLEEAKLNLIDQRNKVEKVLEEIDQSANDSWDDIQKRCRKTSDDVNVEFIKVSGRIEDALKGE